MTHNYCCCVDILAKRIILVCTTHLSTCRSSEKLSRYSSASAHVASKQRDHFQEKQWEHTNRKYKQSVMALLSCATLRLLLSKNLLGHVCLFAGLPMSSRWITFSKATAQQSNMYCGAGKNSWVSEKLDSKSTSPSCHFRGRQTERRKTKNNTWNQRTDFRVSCKTRMKYKRWIRVKNNS